MSLTQDIPLDSWNPAQYERFQAERSQPFRDLQALVAPQDDMFVVDLGCGTGELTRELHQALRARRTVGLDNSANMLSRAIGNAVDGLSFQNGDLASFESPGEFDLIFSNAAIQWVPDHVALLARFTRSLRERGQLAIQVPANDDHITHEAARIVARRSPFSEALNGWTRDRAVLSVEAYSQILYLLRYAEQHVRLAVYPHVLENRDGVVEWVKGTMLTDYQKRLSAQLWPSFLDAYREELFRSLPDVRPFFYPFKRILFWARR
ncbi:MAG: methyltransferase domain-containing protein [Anaerolineae bacterium]|nr:methyltransferase domain-containing protein [Phycisphaerae bacterium]